MASHPTVETVPLKLWLPTGTPITTTSLPTASTLPGPCLLSACLLALLACGLGGTGTGNSVGRKEHERGFPRPLRNGFWTVGPQVAPSSAPAALEQRNTACRARRRRERGERRNACRLPCVELCSGRRNKEPPRERVVPSACIGRIERVFCILHICIPLSARRHHSLDETRDTSALMRDHGSGLYAT